MRTKLAAFERLVHESQSSETDRRQCPEDGGRANQGAPHPECTRIAGWMQMRKEILEITRTQQYAGGNLVPMQIGVQPKIKRQGQRRQGRKERIVRESARDDRRKCYCCRETGHARSQSGRRLKDLADAEGKPVTANSRSFELHSSGCASGRRPRDNVSRDSATGRKKIIMCVCQDRDNDEVGCGWHCSDCQNA